jgi:hypothetical protein
MKSARMSMVLVSLAALSCFGPELGWATRVFTSVVTGTVTATPTHTNIEVDHRVYNFKPNSTADKQAHTVETGQVVDLTLDPTASKNSATVVSVTPHGGT